jgi:3-deoxy-7-phosphoheptulonate synthase
MSVMADERLIAERLIACDSSRSDGIEEAAGFVGGWLASRGIDVERSQHRDLPVLIANAGKGGEDVPLVVRYADVLQVGARNMQNYRLLEAVGRTQTPVLLKRGLAATVEELLLAAEYVLDGGNRQVMLCERGIRTFETHTRFTLPLATVPWLHARTHLPVVVDPSHGTGQANLVESMSAASVAAGADGLIIEVHPDPKAASSDGGQTLDFTAFERTMRICRKVAEAVGRTI